MSLYCLRGSGRLDREEPRFGHAERGEDLALARVVSVRHCTPPAEPPKYLPASACSS
jgi:hypothetical protein